MGVLSICCILSEQLSTRTPLWNCFCSCFRHFMGKLQTIVECKVYKTNFDFFKNFWCLVSSHLWEILLTYVTVTTSSWVLFKGFWMLFTIIFQTSHNWNLSTGNNCFYKFLSVFFILILSVSEFQQYDNKWYVWIIDFFDITTFNYWACCCCMHLNSKCQMICPKVNQVIFSSLPK